MKDNFTYPADVGVHSISRGVGSNIHSITRGVSSNVPKEEPSMLDGILGGGPIGAIMDAFSHYTDGIFGDKPKMPGGDFDAENMPPGLLGPGGLIDGPHMLPTGDFDKGNMPKGFLDPNDDVIPMPYLVPTPGRDMF